MARHFLGEAKDPQLAFKRGKNQVFGILGSTIPPERQVPILP